MNQVGKFQVLNRCWNTPLWCPCSSVSGWAFVLVRPQIAPLAYSERQAEGVVVFVDSLETRAKQLG